MDKLTFCLMLAALLSRARTAVPQYELPRYSTHGDIESFPKIIGGTPATVGEFPAVVSLQNRQGGHFCGGTLIDYDYVLTAAHCVTDQNNRPLNPDDIQVQANDLSITTRNKSPERELRLVRAIFSHPDFNRDTYEYDIAVLAVMPFRPSATLAPAPLAFDSPKTGAQCQLAGWGTTDENRMSPEPILFRVNLRVLEPSACGILLGGGTVSKNMFCAGGLRKDSCYGDSGGALLCGGVVSGVVSFGYGCGHTLQPGVYTDVSQYGAWVDQQMRVVLKSSVPQKETEPEEKGSSSRTLAGTMVLVFMTFMIACLS